MKKFVKAMGIALLSIGFASCASTENAKSSKTNSAVEKASKQSKVKKIKYNEEKYKAAYNSRDYKTCLAMLLGKNKKTDEIRDSLDIAMLNFILGDYEIASSIFNATDDMMFEALTKSVTKEIGAAVGNENAKDYTGNVYESLLVNSINALSYVNQGELEKAVNQLTILSDTKLPEYRRIYGEVRTDREDPSSANEFKNAAATAKQLNKDMDFNSFAQKAPEKPTNADVYKESTLARYLSLVLRQADNDKSQIDSDVKVLSSLAKNFDVSEDANIPHNKGRLDVVALAGLINKQTQGEIYFPSKNVFFEVPTGIVGVSRFGRIKSWNLPVQFKFVYPKYEQKPSQIKKIEVAIDNVGKKSTQVIEDFNIDLEKSVKLRAYNEYNRSLMRSSAKKIAAITSGIISLQAGYQVYRQSPAIPVLGIIGTPVKRVIGAVSLEHTWKLARVGIEAIDLTETADIRQCEFFPESANAVGFTVPEGKYTGKVIYHFANGTVEEKPFSAEVKKGKPTLVVSSCIK